MSRGCLRFFGAVRAVTGTKHLVEWKGQRILLDCGLVQGRRRDADAANRTLPFDPESIDHCILSHAHIDHSGTLPVLVRDGYRGKIWCTHATADLATVMLRDSGYLQESDAKHLNKRRKSGQPRIEPIYTQEDAAMVQPRFRGVDYRETVSLSDDVEFMLCDAGHILGSAMVVLTLRDGDDVVRVGFTGDHGRREMPILKDPCKMPDVDYLVTESTYGDRLHPDRRSLEVDLEKLIDEEQHDGGRILIPAFAVGRTQNVVYSLAQLIAKKRIDPIRVFVDSPLAREATAIVARHPECFDGKIRKLLDAGHDPFYFDGIRYVREVEESKALNDLHEPCIIISASGMLEGGRVLHHLKRSIGRREDCVLVVGYCAPGTLGRRLLDGDDEVRIFGETYRVRCKVRMMAGLSAHADYEEMLESLGHLAKCVRRVFVVHGDLDVAEAFGDRLEAAGFKDCVVPYEGKAYPI